MLQKRYSKTIYLDFDGVIEASHPAHEVVGSFTIEIEPNSNFRAVNTITYSPFVVATLDRFREQYNVEIVWNTSWNESENVLKLTPYMNGLHDGRVMPVTLLTEKVDKKTWTQWKAEAILADQKENPRDFVWCDDNAITHWGEHILENVPARSLFISPESKTGLTIADLEKIEEFLAS